MTASSFGSTFKAVDQSADPDELLRYLDRVRAVSAVHAAKVDSFGMLEAAEGRKVLDLGCGPGDDLRELAALVGASGRAVGVDNSERLVAEARRRTPSELAATVEFVCGDAIALPFPDGVFDACRSDRTIQHVPEAGTALAELARVTAAGGTVVISEMLNTLDMGGDEQDEVGRRILDRFWSDDERRSWMGFMLPLLMSRAGLVEIEIVQRKRRLTDFAEAALLLRLAELADAQAAESASARKEVLDWLDRLERAFHDGRCALKTEFLHFKARKPA